MRYFGDEHVGEGL